MVRIRFEYLWASARVVARKRTDAGEAGRSAALDHFVRRKKPQVLEVHQRVQAFDLRDRLLERQHL
eukprot:3365782-Rhodomonas_salina.1